MPARPVLNKESAMGGITTHVLDTSLGRPAAGVLITLERSEKGGAWSLVGSGLTDTDGRLGTLLANDTLPRPGTYRMTFDTGGYFARSGTPTFFPSVAITFEIGEREQHYHVPLLVSPYGYSTYRGS
jgi:5-hydroxyisourate hydrolase